jgi:hypothetical protein
VVLQSNVMMARVGKNKGRVQYVCGIFRRTRCMKSFGSGDQPCDGHLVYNLEC